MKGRSTHHNPQIRFESLKREAFDDEWDGESPGGSVPTQFYRDQSKTILACNDSPDIGFTYDLNPYRGCEHGCIYCYARPTHEYLGFSSGLDFETKIIIKEAAARLLEEEFRKKSWKGEVVMLSGNVDCYQPIERKLKITRECLGVFLRYRNPVSIVTKNALVLRDLDILKDLASLQLISVCLSITTRDKELSQKMEPRTSVPEMRFKAIEELAKAGVPVSVNIAPVIPGLNDEEIPPILRDAAARGASSAGYTLLRLPYAVKDLFVEWVEREYPAKAKKILNRIMDVRDGKLNDSRFSTRMRGRGEIASAIEQLFDISCTKYGVGRKLVHLRTDAFIRPPLDRRQEEFIFSNKE